LKTIAILGSTGSIGRSCFRVLDSLPGQFQVVALSAGSNVELLAQQIANCHPQVASVAKESDIPRLRSLIQQNGAPLPEILHGPEGIRQAAGHPDIDLLVSAAVGVAGLPATYDAVKRGVNIALANKEVLVVAGALVTAAARESGAALLPVDSEHNGVHQCMRAGKHEEVRRLILTASGGPFRRTPPRDLEHVTVEQALNHPTWKMGSRITIDSATMTNKGFEVIEACWLFDLRPDQVEVLIHPQSTVHCLVEYVDGSLIAQLSVTDMCLPIQYALTYPERRGDGCDLRMDLDKLRTLEFERPDVQRFPCLDLAYQAMRMGGAYPCVLNAADEVAVAAFLDRKIPYLGIARTIAATLEAMKPAPPRTLEDILEVDREARRVAESLLENAAIAGSPALAGAH
jgi:1-deoxy-D-xylulose-5-phosphate reductoisomerase